ncbi:uncharacterized protein LOC105684894 isoform X2 [Athalia rosae]|uniref:uncharacterized protein LOC105684894 isoform X2 n=1 Tax=Athalia rosae TaxID=37344 RepID=UPI002033C755|nr:uncharacterized protein LOC105684894 isoform X2 [Athalia rosae]
MRGSSSELLLDTSQNRDPQKYEIQQQELRRRKLLELGFGASRRRPPRRTCRQRFNFYATSALALVATSGGAALLFLVPLYVDPAISTLAADFSPHPVTCTTSRREDLAGLFNCSWSSCREGCTSDVYRCTHIYVTYTPWSNESSTDNETTANPDNNFTTIVNSFSTNDNESVLDRYVSATQRSSATISATSSSASSASLSGVEVEAILMVNIKGCGYPPIVDCDNFTKELGYEGSKFPCHYSRVNGSIVMADYNREAQIATIMHFFAAPFVVTLATSVALCVMHCDCRCAAPPRQTHRNMRRPRLDDLREKLQVQ